MWLSPGVPTSGELSATMLAVWLERGASLAEAKAAFWHSPKQALPRSRQQRPP